MADEAKSKIDEATEKAYAEASAAVSSPKTVAPEAAKAEPKDEAAPQAAIAAKKAVATKKPAKKAKLKSTTGKKAVARKNVAAKKAASKPKKKTAKKTAPKKAAARKAAPTKKTTTLTELKETIMAKTNTKDFTKTVTEASADVQSRVKAAYDKGSEFASEAAQFNKANLEALIESGKILAGGVQEMARDSVEDTKTAYETMTADAKKMAAIKSPTELFQLQGELARRNFDAMIAYGSKNTEKMIKLANETFAPVSNRMSVAAEKISKAA